MYERADRTGGASATTGVACADRPVARAWTGGHGHVRVDSHERDGAHTGE